MRSKLLPRLAIAAFSLSIAVSAAACQSTYYKTMAAFGKEKRHILTERVDEAREDQTAAKEKFQDALKSFHQVAHHDETNLERTYNRLGNELTSCESRAKTVSKDIESIEQVANDLFAEWEGELKDYSESALRKRSETKLVETKARYKQLHDAMKRAEKSMEPVLKAYRDQVLFLKHNLNAESVLALRGNLATIEESVDVLVKDMEKSIAEAQAFTAAMQQQS